MLQTALRSTSANEAAAEMADITLATFHFDHMTTYKKYRHLP